MTAVRLVAVTVAAGIGLGGPAAAQATDPAERPEQIAQADRPRSFSIPPQPLASALERFADQAGVSFAYRTGDISTLNSPGVSGTLPPREALQQILSGTGVTFTFTGASTVTLARPGGSSGTMVLDPVNVQGVFSVPSQAMIDNTPPPYAGGQVATGGQLGLLGNRSVMDTPFNQTSYTAKKAQDQQARTIRDVLIDDPSVRSFFPDNSWGDANVRIRGFAVSNSATTYGGLYGLLPTALIMAEVAERVEILNGPSALLNGINPANSIGGTINIVPKRAPDADLTQLSASYVSPGQVGTHVDIARRFGPDRQFGIRFNGVFRGGQTEVEWNNDKRGLALLGLDFRGERVRLSADLGYQYGYIGGVLPMLGPANNVALPWAPPSRKNYGQPWNWSQRDDLFGVVRGEVDLTENVTAYVAFGVHDYRAREFLGGDNVTIDNFSGDGNSTPYNLSGYTTYRTGEAGLRAILDTGLVNHQLAFTATTYEQEAGFNFTFGDTYNTNIYNPIIIAQPDLAVPVANKASSTLLSGLALADTLSVADKRIQLTLGARLQRVAATNFNIVSGRQTSTYDQSALSPSVAVLVKPWQNVSIYGNWIQGLQQGATVNPPFANAGEVFPPYKSTQYEAGVKVDWGKFTTTANVFQISQPSVLTDFTTNRRVLGGEQRNQGLEINAFGELVEGVRLLGGVMFLDAVLARTPRGTTDGWTAPFSPGVQFNLAGEWDLPFAPGLTVNGRVIYTGSQYIDTTFPRRTLPDWTRFDLGARYTFDNPGAKGKPLVARFNVENVFDSNYWAGGNSAPYLMLGAPRTFRLGLTAEF